MTVCARVVRRLGWMWVDRRVRVGLDGVEVDGLEGLCELARRGPVVVACTHQAWWDGPLAVWLCHRAGLNPILPMHRHNLAIYPFFEAFGAIGIAGPSGVRAALGRLRGPGDVLWIFPQGAHQRPDEPMTLERGALWLADQASCPVVPVVFDYSFRDRPEPHVRIAVGAAVAATEPALRESLIALRSDRSKAGTALVVGEPLRPGAATRLVSAMWRWTWR